jgi:hypothetical protein
MAWMTDSVADWFKEKARAFLGEIFFLIFKEKKIIKTAIKIMKKHVEN